MPPRRDYAITDALTMVAPGQPLREGLDRILQANMGGLIVVGDGPEVLAICSGGFLLDAEFSPQRLSELAKMDGAIILAPDASRIARANVHLVPNPNVPTSETGTRHRTAERVARSIAVPVISVSERMAVIDRLIMRLAICELLRPAGTPPAVVINEALELARTFSTEESVKFINGMLDAIRRKLEAGAETRTPGTDG